MGLCDNWSDIVVLVLTIAIFKNGGFEHWRWNINYFKLFPFPPFYNGDCLDNSYYHKMRKLDLMAILNQWLSFLKNPKQVIVTFDSPLEHRWQLCR